MKELFEAADKYDVQMLDFDIWGSSKISTDLRAQGWPEDRLVVTPQTFTQLHDPCEELLSLVTDKRLLHDNNPVLNWMMDNLEVIKDAEHHVRPTKSMSKEKIDGPVALILALHSEFRNRNREFHIKKDEGISFV